MTAQKEHKPRELTTKSNIILWIASLVIAFCFVPYVDIFPTGHYRGVVPEIMKPIIYGFLVSAIIRWIAGKCFGEGEAEE